MIRPKTKSFFHCARLKTLVEQDSKLSSMRLVIWAEILGSLSTNQDLIVKILIFYSKAMFVATSSPNHASL